MGGYYEDAVKAAKDFLAEHVLKMGPPEANAKEQAALADKPAKTAGEARRKQGPGFWGADAGN